MDALSASVLSPFLFTVVVDSVTGKSVLSELLYGDE